MKCVLISCFDNYEVRIKPVEEIFKKKGYECEYITSNFDHIKKRQYSINANTNVKQINVPKYKRNLSFMRIFSHYIFSRKVYKYLQESNPDLIYVMLPPNSLARFMALYKRKNKVKLIFDIYDMWPETFPYNRGSLFLKYPFCIWKQLRDKYLNDADNIITECNLYTKKLPNFPFTVIYPSKKMIISKVECNLDRKFVELCYLGSINNIIDINFIIDILSRINYLKPVKLHIIGDGEQRERFLKMLEEKDIETIYHGKVYDLDYKKNIFDKCMFGINIMKESVCVGLTLKSLDYFQLGLPILNNIKQDTSEFVEYYGAGLNVSRLNMELIAEKIIKLTLDDVIKMKQSTIKLFQENFTVTILEDRVNGLIDNHKEI